MDCSNIKVESEAGPLVRMQEILQLCMPSHSQFLLCLCIDMTGSLQKRYYVIRPHTKFVHSQPLDDSLFLHSLHIVSLISPKL